MKKEENIIRGKELHITERDVYKSLSVFGKISAFFVGGFFVIKDTNVNELERNRGVYVFIPPIHERFYWKFIFRFIHSSKNRIPHNK